MNHHVYLGLIAEQPRWDLDVVAASFQGYQYPYLYWPVYRMSLLEGSGAVVGAAWAAAQAALLLPPVWVFSRRLLALGDGRSTAWSVLGATERALACALAFTSVVLLSSLETTANDLLAAVPLVWAFAVMAGTPGSERRLALAAGLWGASAALKLSNAMFLPLLLVWWVAGDYGSRGGWLRRGLALAAGAAVGFGIVYAPWGWQLWRVTGNPFYPYFGALFGAAGSSGGG
jgi:hypothetical protein